MMLKGLYLNIPLYIMLNAIRYTFPLNKEILPENM